MRSSAVVGVLLVLPLLGILLLAPELRSVEGLAVVTQVLVYTAVLGASILLYVEYRLTETSVYGWLALCLTQYSVQGIALAGLRAAQPEMFFNRAGWVLIVDLPAALLILACLRLSDRVRPAADPLGVGLALGLLVAGANVAINYGGDELMTTDPPVVAAQVALIVIGAAIAYAAFTLDDVPGWVTRRLGVGAIALVLNRLATAQDPPGIAVDAMGVVTGLLGAILVVTASSAGLRQSVREQHHSLMALSDQVASMAADERDVRSRLHEITNSLAGITVASSLIHQDGDISVDKRRQLERMLESEASRLSRLLAARGKDPAHGQAAPTLGAMGRGVVDLDEVIWPLVTAQEALGRFVEWHPTGHRGIGDPDAVAEVVNILLDNAARHAPGSRCTVETNRQGHTLEVIVRDDGPGIPSEVRAHLFEWESRGSDSEGQGIGLHLAHRLMATTGSSLRLEGEGAGNTFVISMPAAEEAPSCTPSELPGRTHAY